MIDEVQRECSTHGDRAVVVSRDLLETVRRDLAELSERETLGGFQRHILGSIYVTEAPRTGFPVASILIVATTTPAFARLQFTRNGRRTEVMQPAGYIDKEAAPHRIQRYLSGLLDSGGLHLLPEPRLPRKLLAARSGLAAYGRNNICYVDGMGSFCTLSTFFSDLPCAASPAKELRMMDTCSGCRECQRRCPTGAIRGDRFLVDAERCLTFYNEAGGFPFPDWIPQDAHNSLYGCHRCQTACPVNQDRLGHGLEPTAFDEEETAMLLEGRPAERLPPNLSQKVASLNMTEYLPALPRNLRVLGIG
ncbi:MAG TPA: 4Fe-4S double cluster binding domain-containing protein [Spirochaetia bacterium]|nr:4Fe-4S double cluster binding domain-containing protein [Spirochaetia bacterium]